ncbi:MAG: GNAT family N-acetyltransferase [Pseudomonadota bacterium]
MQIVEATQALAQRYAAEIPDLVWSTGPASYEYIFTSRDLFDALVSRSWLQPETLFAWDATRLAVEDDELLGIEIGFEGPQFRERQRTLGPAWADLLAQGAFTESDVAQIIANSDHASWLNPMIQPGTQYVHALAVKPTQRGKRIGALLLQNAMQRGRDAGHQRFQLDVLSDNPAVEFYRSQGLELLVQSRAPIPEAHGVPPENRMGCAL